MKIKNWWIVVLIVILLLGSILILIKNYNEGIVGGGSNEELTVKVKECCKYIQAGEEKTCSVLEKYSCNYCNRYCS